MNLQWSIYIIFFVVVNIVGFAWLLFHLRKAPKNATRPEDTTGHNYDGIEELNYPLPRWWMWMFWLTFIFAIIYLALYPGLGRFQGLLGWRSDDQWQQETLQAQERYEPLFAKFYEQPIETLATNIDATAIGQNLFINNCAVCHGSDARGGAGFPNLTDANWLYGNDSNAIETTILHGRNGTMPPMIGALGSEDNLNAVVNYVRSLNGYDVDEDLVPVGHDLFEANCAVCHGADATGNTAIGAPNLTNNQWLYGGSSETIATTIRYGRSGVMPAHEQTLGAERVHLLAAYVYSLSDHPIDVSETEQGQDDS